MGGQVPRRLVGIDLGIALRHSVRVLEADGQVVCRSSCVPTVASLTAVVAGRPWTARQTGPGWRWRSSWAPSFPDSGIGAISCCTLPVQVLVVDFLRSPVAECRMETSPIIPELDVPRNILPCFPYRRVHGTVDPLDFHRGIE